MSESLIDWHQALHEHTFLDTLRANGLYTPERHAFYLEWRALMVEYAQLEFDLLTQSKVSS